MVLGAGMLTARRGWCSFAAPQRGPSLRSPILRAALLLGALLAAPAAPAAVVAGWTRVELPGSGSYALRYVPPAAAAAAGRGEALPVVLFLHGSGGGPEGYDALLAPAADGSGAVLLMPRSLFAPLGWGHPGDPAMVEEALALTAAALPVDAGRVGVAGHSAGAAHAYLLAYASDLPFNAVFTLAAPYYRVSALADPSYVPPIRMFYGGLDPNYTTARPRLIEQWQRLGVPWEEELDFTVGHSQLPADSLADGLAFLLAQRRGSAAPCVAGGTALCLRGGRFRVEVAWERADGTTGAGRVVPAGGTDSGLFWFFHPDNWEMLVKVLDGCKANGHFWVFAAATTNVGYTLTVTDTAAGVAWSTANPVGRPARTVTATDALPTCGP